MLPWGSSLRAAVQLHRWAYTGPWARRSWPSSTSYGPTRPGSTAWHLGFQLYRSPDVGRSSSLTEEYIHLHGGTLPTDLARSAILLWSLTVDDLSLSLARMARRSSRGLSGHRGGLPYSGGGGHGHRGAGIGRRDAGHPWGVSKAQRTAAQGPRRLWDAAPHATRRRPVPRR